MNQYKRRSPSFSVRQLYKAAALNGVLSNLHLSDLNDPATRKSAKEIAMRYVEDFVAEDTAEVEKQPLSQ
ncbi:MAG: hypothetical protein HS122_08660 [Opitutaceae bacterium]|nr:hypothetical protein [Opitutaceae bacterium]